MLSGDRFEGTEEEKRHWVYGVAKTEGVPDDYLCIVADKVLGGLQELLETEEGRSRLRDWRNQAGDLGVLSLAEPVDDMLMWGHYADSHRGYCLEFDTSFRPFLFAYRIIYSPVRATFRLFDSNKASAIVEALITKAAFWSYEREWRIIQPGIAGSMAFPIKALKSIIFGAGISSADETALRDFAKQRGHPIKFKRAVVHEERFGLSIIDA